ncbi:MULTISPECIES: glycosyltransferase [Spiribacter]|uniref:glycosyltransferase n=1 Tax=Spiribacter TaxID=1335745 RepID=UPI0013307617|nr:MULTISPECIES: glycosyltransferase [Spiribacter]
MATVADDSADGVARLGCRECWDRHLLQLIESFRADVVHFHALGAELQPGVSSRGFASVAHVRGTHVGCPVDTSNAIYVSQRHAALHDGSVYVHNGIDVDSVPFFEHPSDSLVFLGKVRRSKKGADTAVAVARRTGRTLKLIGGRKLNIPQSWLPFQRRVKALGVLGGEQKLTALGNASALLFPIRWEEPFGLVLIEAMACGTPVIAFDRGAVSEIVEHGVTGFVVKDFEGMCEAVSRINEIDRAACRRHVEAHFSIRRTADGVMACYRRAIAGERW